MLWVWIGFIAFILSLLALDLGVLSRKSETVSVRKAMIFTGFTVLLALLFSFVIYWLYDSKTFVSESQAVKGGGGAVARYLSAWLIEYALSMDNILVIALIFRYFHIPTKYQHRVLFWGVVGALIMRGIMIAMGSVLLAKFEWVRYIFGAILFFTAIKLLMSNESVIDPERTIAARIGRKLFPITPELDGQKLFTRIGGKLMATPLFLVLVIIEGTDVLFAVDSIPAAFAITKDPFIVFTSNIFAILGLRSMYFALAAVIDRFHYLKTALIVVLLFISVKMVIKPAAEHPASWSYEIPAGWSLAIVGGVLISGVVASLLLPSKKNPHAVVAHEAPALHETERTTAAISSPPPPAPPAMAGEQEGGSAPAR